MPDVSLINILPGTKTSDLIMNQETDKLYPEPNGLPVLYETMYKKGNLKGELRFYYTGTMKEAVDAIKSYLEKKNLKHLHTMPFIIDLSSASSLEDQTRMMV